MNMADVYRDRIRVKSVSQSLGVFKNRKSWSDVAVYAACRISPKVPR